MSALAIAVAGSQITVACRSCGGRTEYRDPQRDPRAKLTADDLVVLELDHASDYPSCAAVERKQGSRR
jgi:hypothetical protein